MQCNSREKCTRDEEGDSFRIDIHSILSYKNASRYESSRHFLFKALNLRFLNTSNTGLFGKKNPLLPFLIRYNKIENI